MQNAQDWLDSDLQVVGFVRFERFGNVPLLSRACLPQLLRSAVGSIEPRHVETNLLLARRSASRPLEGLKAWRSFLPTSSSRLRQIRSHFRSCACEKNAVLSAALCL